MKKPVIVAVVIVVIAVLAGGIILAIKRSNKDSTTSVHTSSASTSTPATKAADPNKNCNNNANGCNNAYRTSIKAMAFESNITIKKGRSITWNNSDNVAHTVTETDGQTGPNSGNIPAGGIFSYTFTKTGTYKYHCEYHSDMVATVTVTE